MTELRSPLLDGARVVAIVVALGWLAVGGWALEEWTDPPALLLVVVLALIAGGVAWLTTALWQVDIGWNGWGALVTIVAATATIVGGATLVVVARTATPAQALHEGSRQPVLWLLAAGVVIGVAVGVALEFRKRAVRVFCTSALLLGLVGLAVIGTTDAELDMLASTRDRATVLDNERRALADAVTAKNGEIPSEEDVRKAAQALRAIPPGDDDALADAVTAYLEAPEEERPQARASIDAIATPGDSKAEQDLVRLLDASAKEPARPPSEQSAVAIRELCRTGGGSIDTAAAQSSCTISASPDVAVEPPPGVALVTCPSPTDGGEPVDLRVDLDHRSTGRRADLLAAVASCELTPTRIAIGEAKSDALGAAQREIDDALAALGQGGEPIGLPDAITGGAAAVTAVLNPGEAGSTIELSPVGWLVVAGLLLIGYRWLEIQAGLHRTGPVAFSFEGKEKDDSVEAIHFREAVLRNVREPGAVPGSSALAPVTDLLGAVTTPHGPVVKAVLTVVQSVFATPSGYTIKASWRSGTAGGSGAPSTTASNGAPASAEAEAAPSAVFAQISETRTGRQLASTTISGADPNEAARKAGYWCAGWIIARSRDVPAWARWDESSARALAAYDWEDGLGTSVDELAKEASTAPTTGVLLVALGYRYDLDRKFGDAMELYARTRALYPRYLVGRYRASASLGMLASDHAGRWEPLPEHIKEQIRRYLAQSDADAATLTDGATLLAAAGTLSDNDQALAGRWRVLLASLRRSERDYWLSLLRSGLQAQLVHLAASGDLVNDVRRSAPVPNLATRASALAGTAERDGTSYQIAYNLACCYAINGQPDAAVRWLFVAFDHPFSNQLTKEWLRVDPDLEVVRDQRPEQFATLIDRAVSDVYSNESTSGLARARSHI